MDYKITWQGDAHGFVLHGSSRVELWRLDPGRRLTWRRTLDGSIVDDEIEYAAEEEGRVGDGDVRRRGGRGASSTMLAAYDFHPRTGLHFLLLHGAPDFAMAVCDDDGNCVHLVPKPRVMVGGSGCRLTHVRCAQHKTLVGTSLGTLLVFDIASLAWEPNSTVPFQASLRGAVGRTPTVTAGPMGVAGSEQWSLAATATTGCGGRGAAAGRALGGSGNGGRSGRGSSSGGGKTSDNTSDNTSGTTKDAAAAAARRGGEEVEVGDKLPPLRRVWAATKGGGGPPVARSQRKGKTGTRTASQSLPPPPPPPSCRAVRWVGMAMHGEVAFVCYSDCSMAVVDVDRIKLLASTVSHFGPVLSLAWRAAGPGKGAKECLVSGSVDQSISFWDSGPDVLLITPNPSAATDNGGRSSDTAATGGGVDHTCSTASDGSSPVRSTSSPIVMGKWAPSTIIDVAATLGPTFAYNGPLGILASTTPRGKRGVGGGLPGSAPCASSSSASSLPSPVHLGDAYRRQETSVKVTAVHIPAAAGSNTIVCGDQHGIVRIFEGTSGALVHTIDTACLGGAGGRGGDGGEHSNPSCFRSTAESMCRTLDVSPSGRFMACARGDGWTGVVDAFTGYAVGCVLREASPSPLAADLSPPLSGAMGVMGQSVMGSGDGSSVGWGVALMQPQSDGPSFAFCVGSNTSEISLYELRSSSSNEGPPYRVGSQGGRGARGVRHGADSVARRTPFEGAEALPVKHFKLDDTCACFAVHPSGDYLLALTTRGTLLTYNIWLGDLRGIIPTVNPCLLTHVRERGSFFSLSGGCAVDPSGLYVATVVPAVCIDVGAVATGGNGGSNSGSGSAASLREADGRETGRGGGGGAAASEHAERDDRHENCVVLLFEVGTGRVAGRSQVVPQLCCLCWARDGSSLT